MTVVVFAGDSITAGSSASAVGKRYPNQVFKIVGARMSQTWGNAGVAGDTAAALLARIDDVITGPPSPQLLVVMIGTNDVDDLPVSDYETYISGIRNEAILNGVDLVFCTIPARNDYKDGVTTFNVWLRQWCHRRDIPCVDVYAATVDPATGGLLAAYDSGDGVHPNDAGHLAIANAVATELKLQLDLPTQQNGGGIVSGSWTHLAGTAASLSIVDGYQRFSVNNATGSPVITTYGLPVGTEGVSWAEGDLLLVSVRLRGSTADAINKVQLQDNSAPAAGGFIESTFPAAEPGIMLRTITIPAITNTLRLGVNIRTEANATAYVDIIANVWNLTALDLEELEV